MCGIEFTPSTTSRLAQRRQLRHEDPLLRSEPDNYLPILRLYDLSYPKLGVPYSLPRTKSGADQSLFRVLPASRQSTAPASASRSSAGGDSGDGTGLELFRNLREKARGHLVLSLAVGRANPGVRERQRFLCPRDTDVRQPALVLQPLRVVQRHQGNPALACEPVRLRE